MIEVLRSTDPVAISFVDSLLDDVGIDHVIADQIISVIDGSLGVIPTRILVAADRVDEARQLIADARV
ncbi:MAG: DUF2007 domain-containing protein [Jiangellaceae bacterium]